MHLGRFGAGCGDALEFAGGLAGPAAFDVGEREISGHVGLARARGIGRAIGLEHRDCARPVLERDEHRAGVEFRGLADRGARRQLADTQEVVHGTLRVAH